MRNFLEKFLISCLLIISVLLGLSFWLNVKYSFNMFSSKHWLFLSQLQASNAKITIGFYASFIIAFIVFLFGTLAVFSIKHERKAAVSKPKTAPQPNIVQQPQTTPVVEQTTAPQTPSSLITRPQRLNLPKNIAAIAAHNFAQQKNTQQKQTQDSPYNSVIKDIFEDAGYTIKQNPVISGFTSNLFAIGNNEIIWMGGIDSDINKIKNAVVKLNDTFQETLDDISININSFILDTHHTYDSDDTVLIFHDIEEIREYISNHPADPVKESDKENFDAYSEYIDTIIKYIKNI